MVPLYILSFGLAGGLTGLLWNLTSGWVGAIGVGIAASMVLLTGCCVTAYLVCLVDSNDRLNLSPENILFVAVMAVVMGCIWGLFIWLKRKKDGNRAATLGPGDR